MILAPTKTSERISCIGQAGADLNDHYSLVVGVGGGGVEVEGAGGVALVVVEVDVPTTQAEKRSMLQAAGIDTRQVQI